jgi:serine phosphatase RsbU (regulator of sigma subunit)
MNVSEDTIKSQAFERAALNSEWYRTIGLLGLLGSLTTYAIARALVTSDFQLLMAQAVILLLAIGYEVLMLSKIRRGLKQEAKIGWSFWLLSVLIETQLPTIALIILIESQLLAPYQALVAPVVLLYFIFIILSTLRLSPSLSLITGTMSAFGYVAVLVYTKLKFSNSDSLSMLPLGSYFVYAALIFIGGVVAAIVAGQIRVHVTAALREAELKGELERVNHDLDIAKSIQQGLLPSRSPCLDQFEMAGWNQPADQTGGDYFDWQTLPDGRLAISLGDATGHGIGPALVSASCRAYARASFLAGVAQDTVLEALNRLLAADLSPNRFVTFAVVFLDPIKSRLSVLSAGHGPILWYRYAKDSIENLEAQGIPLGMIAGVKYGQGTEGSLESGDILALLTDGFYEWENPEGEEFGLGRLEAVIRESRDYSAEDVIARLRSAVANFCKGTVQKDDLTAVILKRKIDRLATAA